MRRAYAYLIIPLATLLAGGPVAAAPGPASLAAPAGGPAAAPPAVAPVASRVAALNTAAVDPDGGPRDPADVYRYLDDPGMTGEGQQPPHAMLRPYADAGQAAQDAERTPWTRSLNGDWRLTIHRRPDDVPADFADPAYDISGWPTASVPHTWQSDYIDHPMFRNIAEEIWPDAPPRVPRDINPTGAYVRSFQVPAHWSGRRALLRFDGVTSGYFVWVNGRYIGYDSGGYTPAEFDVTDAVRPGANRIAVQVHRWGSGAYLEDVDQWRYSGIFRDVTLYAPPRARLADAYLTTDLDADYRDATLSARVDLVRAADAPAGEYGVRATLRDPAGRSVTTVRSTVDLSGDTARTTLLATVADPAKWSAEQPHLYRLVLELLDPAGRVVHATAQNVGFREVAVADRQILVNGERILIKGTNRAETDPDTGRHVSRQAQRRDVMLMKRLHINAVRTSHYPSDPYLYDLADRYGLWIADEVDIETHSHENCPGNCLASRPEWQAAFADRFAAMVARDKNHPSVIIWDTGNEAGLGTAHFAMAQWADANEPTRLLYHQSNNPDGDAPYADVAGPRYPSPGRLESLARSTTKPIVMGEYDHAMGNSLGNFAEFWDLARRYPQVQGGFIWDWAEANPRQPLLVTPDASASRIQAFAVGKPELAAGHRGQALDLSSLDDFVDVFRDPRLDVAGSLTLDAWVKPGTWTGSFPIVTKGQQYGLQMRDERTLEFGVDVATGPGTGARRTATAAVPDDWYGSWHRVTGVYDGATMRLYVDGAQVAEAAATGAIRPGLYEVNVGRNAETQQDNTGTRLAHGLVDDVRIYPDALTAEQLSGGADPYDSAVLALNFDSWDPRGDFLSLGLSLSGTDGLVGSDRYLQPETVEMAWAHAPVRFTAVDAAAGTVTVHNEQSTGALEFRLRWSLTEVDRVLRRGARTLTLAPGATAELALGAAPANPDDRQRWLNVSAETVRDLPWAKRGWRLGYDQFPAGGRVVPGALLPPDPGVAPPRVTREPDAVVVAGSGWRYRFDTEAGTLSSMDSRGAALLTASAGPLPGGGLPGGGLPGGGLPGGPALSAYRPPTSNETYDWGTADRNIWHAVGLDRLRTTVTGVDVGTGPGGTAVVEVDSRVAGPDTGALLTFEQTMRYVIDGSGQVTLAHRVRATGSRVGALPYLPRVGFSLRVPDELDDFAYYGRGPAETYNDRGRGSPVGRYHDSVDGEYVRYSRPQAYGNHTDVRWARLSDGRRAGLLVGALGGDLDVSVTPYDALERAEYDFQLPLVRNQGWTTMHVATVETGMGETPNSVQAPHRAAADREYDYRVVLRPLTRAELRAGGVPDSRAAAPCPPDVTLDTDGQLQPGQPEPVRVTVSARCAAGLTGVSVGLDLPEGWTATPASVDLGRVAAGPPAVAEFAVDAPAGTDFGTYPIAATVAYTSPPGFAGTVTDRATVSAPLPAGFGWLSDRAYEPLANGWGPVEKDMSNGEQAAGDGRPISIGGVTYAKGLGAHAVSRVRVALDGRCTVFRADVGVDDEMGASGSVGFEVWVDGERRAASPVMAGGAAAYRISADLTGGQTMELVVTDGGNGIGADHGDWAAARIGCAL